MPANPKYLTTSSWSRAGKISAAIVGGYLLSVTFHLALASWFNRVNMVITAAYSGFMLWVALMVVAFLFRSAWKVWLLYLVLTGVFAALAFLGRHFNPQGLPA